MPSKETYLSAVFVLYLHPFALRLDDWEQAWPGLTGEGAEEGEFLDEDGDFPDENGEFPEEAIDEAGLGALADDSATILKATFWQWGSVKQSCSFIWILALRV